LGQNPKSLKFSNSSINLTHQLLECAISAVAVSQVEQKKVNPKRLARQVAKEMPLQGISIMAQEVLKHDIEQHKKERKAQSRIDLEAEKQQKWLLARQKAKARHRGKG
jgi:hypothetical protein